MQDRLRAANYYDQAIVSINFILYLIPSKDCRRKIKETLSEVERATDYRT